MVLNYGRGTAAHHARRAWTFRENLPATWAALAAGTLDEPRARDLASGITRTTRPPGLHVPRPEPPVGTEPASPPDDPDDPPPF